MQFHVICPPSALPRPLLDGRADDMKLHLPAKSRDSLRL
jgi:hypothetical protein